MKKNYYLRGSGLTLIELIVVMCIISVLAGIGVYSYQGYVLKARDGKRKADLEQIRSALEMYRTDNQTYPATGTQEAALAPYLSWPTDPKNVSPHVYVYSGGGNSYSLCVTLEIDSTSYCVANP